MATASVTFGDVSPDDERAAVWKLDTVNADRVAHHLDPFPAIKDYIEYQIINQALPQWKHQQAEAEERLVGLKALFLAATATTRDQVVALLTP